MTNEQKNFERREKRRQKKAGFVARLRRLLVQAFALLVGYLDAGDFEARKIFWHWYRRAPDGAVVLRPLSPKRQRKAIEPQRTRRTRRTTKRSRCCKKRAAPFLSSVSSVSSVVKVPRRRLSPDAELRRKIKGLFMAFKLAGEKPPAELRAWSSAELRPLKPRKATEPPRHQGHQDHQGQPKRKRPLLSAEKNNFGIEPLSLPAGVLAKAGHQDTKKNRPCNNHKNKKSLFFVSSCLCARRRWFRPRRGQSRCPRCPLAPATRGYLDLRRKLVGRIFNCSRYLATVRRAME